jgi:hypothetical protein
MNLLLFISLILLCCCRIFGYEETYIGAVTADNILYTSVTIPRHAYEVLIEIWKQVLKSSPIKPKVLVRYNALPSLDSYDKLLEFDADTDSIVILDQSPTASVLYLAVWGGELLHSYRYFAGSPEAIGISLTTTIKSCDNEFQLYNYETHVCEDLPLISMTSHMKPQFQELIALYSNYTIYKLYSMLVPSKVSSLNLEFSLDFCSYFNNNGSFTSSDSSTVEVLIEFFLDQTKEELNYYYVESNYSLSSVCSSASSREQALSLVIPFPLNGLWIMKPSFLLHNYLLSSVLPIHFSVYIDYSLFLTRGSMNQQFNYSLTEMTISHQDPYYTRYSSPSLLLTSSPISPDLPYSLTLSSSQGILFSFNLMNNLNQLSPNGKSFQIQLSLDYTFADQTTDSLEKAIISDFISYIQSKSYTLSGRIGNIPFNPNNHHLLEAHEFLSLQAENAFELLSYDSSVSVHSSSNDINHPKIRATYQWNILHPFLPLVNDMIADNFFLLLTEDYQNITESFKQNFIISSENIHLNVVIGYCPPNTCDHGICVIQSNYIQTSTCYCK